MYVESTAISRWSLGYITDSCQCVHFPVKNTKVSNVDYSQQVTRRLRYNNLALD